MKKAPRFTCHLNFSKYDIKQIMCLFYKQIKYTRNRTHSVTIETLLVISRIHYYKRNFQFLVVLFIEWENVYTTQQQNKDCCFILQRTNISRTIRVDLLFYSDILIRDSTLLRLRSRVRVVYPRLKNIITTKHSR